jgi:hypothetical protein
VRREPLDEDAANEPRAPGDQDRFFWCRHRRLRAPPARGQARCRVKETRDRSQ